MSSNLRRRLAYLPLVALLALPFVVEINALAAEDPPATPAAAVEKAADTNVEAETAKAAEAKKAADSKPTMLQRLLPIGILLLVVGFVLARLPKVDVGHSKAFVRRRTMNWLPLGLTYSFLYMARYNLTVFKNYAGIDTDDYSIMFMVGTITYGLSFIINGPLTDKLGGRATIIIAAVGASATSLVMGLCVLDGWSSEQTPLFAVLYAVNMYFQSFGAVAIVKVNAPWFHVRERGTFSAIFGILISLGIYFAYDWGAIICENLPHYWVYFIPAILLIGFAIADIIWVRDTPGQVPGLEDFDPGDAKVGEGGQKLTVWQLSKLMLTNKIILTIALIEFCSGFLRQSIMQYMYIFAKETGRGSDLVFANWGVFICCAGILGGILAGVISDRVFQSRRGPVSAVLYAVMLGGGILALFLYPTEAIGPLCIIMSVAIIGVHGMLSGTASMDFGGRKNTGLVVGIIDGFVYLGTGTMALINAFTLPSTKTPEASVPANWLPLYIAIVPVAIIGLVLALRLWNAKPTRAGGGH